MMNDDLLEDQGNIQQNKKISRFSYLSTCQKVCSGCLLITGLAMFILSFFLPSIVDQTIESSVPEQVILSEHNSGLWAKLPGDSKVDLLRVLTVFEPTNLLDVIFRGKKPEFTQHESVYTLKQIQEFTDRNYTNSEVSCNRYQNQYFRYVTFEEVTQNDQKYNVLNPGLFGGWYLGTHLPQPKLTWMTIGQVLDNVQEQLIMNIYYLAFHYQFVKDESSSNALLKMVEDERKRKNMFFDPFMGLSNPDTMENWVRLGLEGHDFGVAGQHIRDYFDISQELLSNIRKEINKQLQAVNQSAMSNSYKCNPYGQDPEQKKYKYDCNGNYFAALQWQSSGVSANPPPGLGILPTDSVNFTNNTLHDYIEIAFYYKGGEFEADYGKIEFDLDWAYQFLNRNYQYPIGPYLTDWNILQHKGNVEFIYEVGAKFDKSKNLEDLEPIRSRFEMSSLELAHVVYRWIQQMGVNFAFRQNIGGNIEHGVIGMFASESIFYSFRNISEFLLPQLVASEVIHKNKWKDCQDMLTQSIDGITNQQLNSICNEWGQQLNLHQMLEVQKLCTFGVYGQLLQEFGQKHKLSQNQIFEICSDAGATDNSFQHLTQVVHSELKDLYDCQYDRCSKQELAIKQFARCEITLNPPSSFQKQRSIHFWNNQIFPRPFEYGYFADEFKDIFKKEPQVLTDFDAKRILHFKGIFNPLAITSAFVYELNHPTYYDKFVDIYQFREYEHLTQYLRFAAIQGVLGGATTLKTPKELFFGYSEPLGEDLKSRDPAGNGDKGINSWVKLGDANMTMEDRLLFDQILITGESNVSETRFIKTMNNFDHAMYNFTYFDGNKTITKWENPWQDYEYINQSTDGITFKPFLQQSDIIRLYVPQLYRVLEMKSTENGPKLFGLDTLHFQLNIDNLAVNEKYTNKWNGTINLEKPFEAPIVVSLPHFYQADEHLSKAVIIKDQKGNPIVANEYDSIYANIEKFSGAPLQAVIQFMISMRIKKDSLFVNVSDDMVLPLLTLYNSGNFTEAGVNQNFKDLKIGLAIKSWGWYLIMSEGLLLIIGAIAIILIVKCRSKRVESEISEL